MRYIPQSGCRFLTKGLTKTNAIKQRIVEDLALKHDGNIASNATLYFKNSPLVLGYEFSHLLTHTNSSDT